MESEGSESQTSRSTEPRIAFGEGNEFGLSEVHAYLTDKLRRLSVVIDKYHSLGDNNPVPPVTGDLQHLLKYKTQLLSCLSQQLRTLHPQEWTRFSAHVQLDVMESLKKEVLDLRTLLGVCEKQLAEDKKQLADLEEKIKDLKEMYEERQKTPEVHKMDSLVPVQKNLSVEFNKHRRELNDMIEQLFPDDSTDLVDFLQVLTKAYFDDERGDPYVTLDGPYHCLEMLLEADIITRHPHDFKKFRLTNLLQ
ncbi:hypothetical protein B7P43_G06761 [Cryptotermes secundus]|uniref:Centromere protein K n=1 Tax=Cryptotermes secundus TaxID=105785 RepID=A0A2J7RID3_9NEOP|nr:uncharacterized protein LOC111875486 [Cryptotermes secundus]PNF40591.1 hypothetical protein B7P43_G06761 [Cryptotermes secundus]